MESVSDSSLHSWCVILSTFWESFRAKFHACFRSKILLNKTTYPAIWFHYLFISKPSNPICGRLRIVLAAKRPTLDLLNNPPFKIAIEHGVTHFHLNIYFDAATFSLKKRQAYRVAEKSGCCISRISIEVRVMRDSDFFLTC